jgi:lipid-binding SYLF domain-containing protein
MKSKLLLGSVLLLLVAILALGDSPLLARNVDEHYERRAQKAANVLTEIMGIPEGAIPNELMEKAQAIAVFPDVIKGAFGVGGRYGKGLVSQRQANGKWSAPAFVEIGGGSFGFQIGVQSTDLVLVFTNDEGVRSLLSGKVTLGGDASVAAGPVGRNAAAATDIKLNSAIYSYSRSKGLFAGVSLDGAVVTMDDSANRKVYGKSVTGEDILLEHGVRSNATVMPFIDALNRYSPARMSR